MLPCDVMWCAHVTMWSHVMCTCYKVMSYDVHMLLCDVMWCAQGIMWWHVMCTCYRVISYDVYILSSDVMWCVHALRLMHVKISCNRDYIFENCKQMIAAQRLEFMLMSTASLNLTFLGRMKYECQFLAMPKPYSLLRTCLTCVSTESYQLPL